MARILGTIKRGKVKVYSQKEMAYLHYKKLDHTHYKYKGNRLVAKVRHTY